MKPERDNGRILVRLPEHLREKLKETAGENYRSINAEIVFRLARSYGTEKQKGEEARA